MWLSHHNETHHINVWAPPLPYYHSPYSKLLSLKLHASSDPLRSLHSSPHLHPQCWSQHCCFRDLQIALPICIHIFTTLLTSSCRYFPFNMKDGHCCCNLIICKWLFPDLYFQWLLRFAPHLPCPVPCQSLPISQLTLISITSSVAQVLKPFLHPLTILHTLPRFSF